MKTSFIMSSVLALAMMVYDAGEATSSSVKFDPVRGERPQGFFEKKRADILSQLTDEDLGKTEKEVLELSELQKSFYKSAWIQDVNPDPSFPRLEIKPRDGQIMLVRDVYTTILEKLPSEAFKNTIMVMEIRSGALGVEINEDTVQTWAKKWNIFSGTDKMRGVDFSKEKWGKISADLDGTVLERVLIVSNLDRAFQEVGTKTLATSGVTDIDQMQRLVEEEKQYRNKKKIIHSRREE